ncbi:MAG: hypothetical protein A3C80_00485 [Candidatus Ryanbacteria bacterium RIFCSPHIGHO2_02_FULL_45_43]|uniref:VTC domain-containing protein n=1 Tax=Candidatus Ryanbacteria bacterium RIFCSPHIGHO2_01_45_13 TaxID=1802112 RepID=A0A1G2FXB7_9BACT|nr:MAG: hypothetical protein A2718_01875 [Candidatus Ryanbacteria bacterium RIFCSPHIGHO2_01_FULL_44_130]OGZ42719.1 MAG: hypothetical protein A2W41_03190 [Candidatus Ryanbacteria bacterium RIFCSPHIGHO2_01_45_13]OGZ48793.1 MAG: hypothetical protein A3C80_00485 [Candidatus Ryanbacteria bacterium RIFCSPHIGHO2_02_FULL_45_43]OGZ50825.1 MAG: hypothetical protein A3E55_02505 [Candidatus Ryanbacteria bacterium RIFCSPHIGHO2_12_FULL_44_20]OGZ52036.1 MAG: hypothetical protein A3A17_01090 [Candidatus Ryanba
MQHFSRYEFKYILPESTEGLICNKLLQNGLQSDPNSVSYHQNAYPVTSLYFDTPTMEDYLDKAGGLLRRKKIRVRIYAPFLNEHTPEIWLEKKEKYEMVVFKKRVLLDARTYETLLYGSRVPLVTSHPTFLPLLTQRMKPSVMVRYIRRPYISKGRSDLRITIDSKIEASKTSDLRVPHATTRVHPGFIVMEVKFANPLPYWFRRLLDEFQLSRTTFSKYAEAVESVYRFHPIPR